MNDAGGVKSPVNDKGGGRQDEEKISGDGRVAGKLPGVQVNDLRSPVDRK